jgi:hypothetical protein
MFEGSLVGMGSQVVSCNMGSLVRFIKSRRFNKTMYVRFCVPAIMIECRELVPYEEGLLDMLFWVVVPNQVDPSKDKPSNYSLRGECGYQIGEITILWIPPNAGGRSRMHLECQGGNGSSMVLD